MASRKVFNARPSYKYPNPETDTSGNEMFPFEFNEFDIWSSGDLGLTSFEPWLAIPTSRPTRKTEPIGKNRDVSGSLPVKVPDWPSILKEEYRRPQGQGMADGDGDLSEDGKIPPHEYLARKRGASFSVQEGIGRTLKGRDLRRVRNAIWQKIGFED